MKARHAVMRATREFFDGRDFIEVETPALVPSPGLDLHIEAFEVVGARSPRFLRTSPEYQMKRLLAAGFSRIYQIGKSFRRGEEGALHQPEFTMLEWYRSFSCSADLMCDTEQLVVHLARRLHGHSEIPARGAPNDVAPPWERLSVEEAFRRYARCDLIQLEGDEERFYRILAEQVEPRLGRGRPTFLTRYPASMAQQARLHPDDPRVADRFEAYIDGVELCNGYGELTDHVEQRQRLESEQRARRQSGKPVYPIDTRFLSALEQGIPPSSGNALGMDRLVMLMTGADRLDEVVAFSADRI